MTQIILDGVDLKWANHPDQETWEDAWDGSLYVPGQDVGYARKTGSDLTFLKDQEYGIAGWVKMDDMDAQAINTLARLDTTDTSNGWRVVMEKASGKYYIGLQENNTFTQEQYQIPDRFIILNGDKKNIHWSITWRGVNSTSVDSLQIRINGHRLGKKIQSISWADAEEVASGGRFWIGHEYDLNNFRGHAADYAWWNRLLYPTDIFKAMNWRMFGDAYAWWPLNEGIGSTAFDMVGDNDLTLAGNTLFVTDEFPTFHNKLPGQVTYQVKWSGIAMNYGQDTQGGAYNSYIINRDLDRMYSMGIRRLRLAMSNYEYTDGVDTSKTLALAALAKGFEVEWGVGHPGDLDDASWADYVTGVLAAASWAQSNGITAFSIGNEIEYRETTSGSPLTDSVSKIKALATSVQAVFTSGDVLYAMAQSSMEFDASALTSEQDPYDVKTNGWLATGKGNIDKLGYNVYGDANQTTEQAKTQVINRTQDLYDVFGANLYISEWHVPDAGPARPTTDDGIETMLSEELVSFQSMGLTQVTFFAWRWDTIPNNSELFALIQNSIFRGFITALFDIV